MVQAQGVHIRWFFLCLSSTDLAVLDCKTKSQPSIVIYIFLSQSGHEWECICGGRTTVTLTQLSEILMGRLQAAVKLNSKVLPMDAAAYE